MKAPKKEDYKICIIGLGYVGLPLAARFSLKGFNVTGFDLKEERVSQLRDNIDVNVWDPCLNHSQIDHINNSGIRITNIIPQEIELAFVCVYHREIIEFLNSYEGMIYDYRKIN